MTALRPSRRRAASCIAPAIVAFLFAGCGSGGDDLTSGEGKVAPRFQKLQEDKDKAVTTKKKR